MTRRSKDCALPAGVPTGIRPSLRPGSDRDFQRPAKRTGAEKACSGSGPHARRGYGVCAPYGDRLPVIPAFLNARRRRRPSSLAISSKVVWANDNCSTS